MKHLYLISALILFSIPAFAANMADDFDKIDSDNNDIISKSEMAEAQKASLDAQNRGIMNLLDANADGAADKAEYMKFYSKLAADEKELQKVEEQFNLLDKDNNNLISIEELSYYRTNSLEEENEEFFKAADTNQDGEISRREYEIFVESLENLFKSADSEYLK